MISFEEHSDGRIYVRNEEKMYCDTWENFEADFDIVMEELPPGVRERIYVPGKRHALNGEEGTMGGGPLPYSTGDAAIASIEDGLAAQTARNPPETPPSEEESGGGPVE